MIITLIYAISENKAIGSQNTIPWRLSGDMKYFKANTLGKPVIMGRKTFDSLGKALPKRRNIVISRQTLELPEGVELVHSLEEAITICAQEPEVCIIGGAMIYKEALAKGIATQIRQTLVHAEVEGDTFFDFPDENAWELVEVEACAADEKNEFAYTITRHIRRNT
ncbi:MAG: dihydrofolate reductase [Bacteroidia bacterium]